MSQSFLAWKEQIHPARKVCSGKSLACTEESQPWHACRMVATPMVSALRGTWRSPKKSLAASSRVTASSHTSRVRLSLLDLVVEKNRRAHARQEGLLACMPVWRQLLVTTHRSSRSAHADRAVEAAQLQSASEGGDSGRGNDAGGTFGRRSQRTRAR